MQALPQIPQGRIVQTCMETPFDPRRLIARSFAPRRQVFAESDAMVYALGLGFGLDPADAGQVDFVYEGVGGGALKIVPTFANVLGYPGFWAKDRDTGIDWRQLVHAEQEVVLHRSLPARGDVTGHNRVTAIWDRGAGKGAYMQQVREICDSTSGSLLATVTQLSLMRGNGCAEGSSDGAPPSRHSLPSRAPDLVCDLRSSPQAALIYRLSGDRNPLHADFNVARAAGFERPILHGMATMGIAAHAVLRSVLRYEPARFRRMRVRFSAAALPGDSFRTELWKDGDIVSLRTTALERGVVVLDNGLVQLD